MSDQPNNPLHGLTLETILSKLQDKFGWDGLYARIRVNCFVSNPSIKSALKFLRKTQWARDKVEALYIHTFTSASSMHKPSMHKPQRSRFDKEPATPETRKSPYASSASNKSAWPASNKSDAKKSSSEKASSKHLETRKKSVSETPPANVWTMNK